MRVLFGCGHVLVSDDLKNRPCCRECGDGRIERVDAGPPHITGHATGPHVTPKVLGPVTVSVAERHLPLREQERA